MFIQDGSIYENLLAQLAVGSFMSDSHAKRYVEMRIAPGNTMKDDLRQIQQNDEYITGSSFAKNFRIGKDDFHYIYHLSSLKIMSFVILITAQSSAYSLDTISYVRK